MNTEITGNEPAFPLSPDGNKELGYSNGLTIRQHFAGLAMQGMLSNSIDNQQGIEPFWHMGNERLAESAVLQADALIAELNKQKTEI